MASQGVLWPTEPRKNWRQPDQSRRTIVTGAARLAIVSGVSGLGGCGIFNRHDPTGGDPAALTRTQVVPFSSSRPGLDVPDGWEPTKLWRTQRRTHYQTIHIDGQTVIKASADQSASGIECAVGIEADNARRLRWRWQASALIDGSDVGISQRDDCVARLALAMDGDLGKLSFRDMLFREQASLFAGMDLPYSTLIYLWDRVQPVNTVVCLNETSRIRYLVVESGPSALGEWREYDRDIHADMQYVFGEQAGKVVRLGVTTDANNLKTTAQAIYGDIRIDS